MTAAGACDAGWGEAGPRSPLDALEAVLLEQLSSARAGLPVLPAVASAALDLAGDPAATVAQMADLVSRDPPICARFLSLANSALYAGGRTIDNVRDAILRVGMGASRDLLFQVVYAASTRGLRAYQAEVADSFARSVACGVIARSANHTLSLRTGEAYLSGLLHDIGEARVYRILAGLRPAPEPELARVLVARHHARAGAEIARAWRLPDDLVRVCLEHHAPGAPATPALRVVRLADALVDPLRRAAAGGPLAVEAASLGDLLPPGADLAALLAAAERDVARL